MKERNIDYKKASDAICTFAARLILELKPYYRITPEDEDCYIWDSASFLLGYLQAFEGLSMEDEGGVIYQISKMYPDLYFHKRSLSLKWMLNATSFYGHYLSKYRANSHSFYDIILFNLCHTSIQKSETITTEFDSDVMLPLWDKLMNFILRYIIPEHCDFIYNQHMAAKYGIKIENLPLYFSIFEELCDMEAHGIDSSGLPKEIKDVNEWLRFCHWQAVEAMEKLYKNK